jgi:hypothetical protein
MLGEYNNMNRNELANNIYPELLIEFEDRIKAGTLKLNPSTLEKILEIIHNNGYMLIKKDVQGSSANLDRVNQILTQWIQVEDNVISYIPSEQIFHDLASEGWIILPPGGVVVD